MTHGETQLMNALIKEAVAAAVSPLRAEMAALKARHSGVHKDLGRNIRESQSDIETRVDDTFDAVARRDQQLVAALNEVRAAVASGTKTTAESIAPVDDELKRVKADTAKTLRAVRFVLAGLAGGAVTALLNWLQHLPAGLQ